MSAAGGSPGGGGGDVMGGVAYRPTTAALGVFENLSRELQTAKDAFEALMKEVEAKRMAQAMLIGAREEVAALRALANAARLASPVNRS